MMRGIKKRVERYRTDHKNAGEFVLGAINPNTTTCSDWTTGHDEVRKGRERKKRERKTVERREP
jgi:hypothetical protein